MPSIAHITPPKISSGTYDMAVTKALYYSVQCGAFTRYFIGPGPGHSSFLVPIVQGLFPSMLPVKTRLGTDGNNQYSVAVRGVAPVAATYTVVVLVFPTDFFAGAIGGPLLCTWHNIMDCLMGTGKGLEGAVQAFLLYYCCVCSLAVLGRLYRRMTAR